jgi:hypothetical protein
MNFLSLACFPKPVLVCTFWLCTSLDVEAGLCNPLSKKSRSRFFIRGDDAWEIYDNEIVESVANDIKAAVETLRVRLVCCIWCNQARWVQYPRDWFPESDSEPS